eukprot:CAMPEP_0194373128 /NCGR_PEP_ID=MMETSP0174-20130528/21556_1 /TAXON_ID=216777 /ORGANISM="Proboscia alata, Strain PI-D3" /LENGTH=435 /DNA_ID=CAMNT_0039152031 /DNA_START=17 /DNA_END=1324 /DNA_ORIENTATION=-
MTEVKDQCRDTSSSYTVNKRKAVSQRKPPRRSLRGSSSIEQLTQYIVENKNVLFITGAGLSAASGIRPFRGEDGLWSEVVWSNATREAFRRDPLSWYNSFWLKYFPPSYENTHVPNEGHEAIAILANLPLGLGKESRSTNGTGPKNFQENNNNVRVITQNVDGLHSSTLHKWDTDKLIEAHGRVGLYKCLPESDSDTDDESDEEEGRKVKLGSRRKRRERLRRANEIASSTQSKQESKNNARTTPKLDELVNDRHGRSRITMCPHEILNSIPAHDIIPRHVRNQLDPKFVNKSHKNPPQSIKPLNSSDQYHTSIQKPLKAPPLCPNCKRPCPPQSLLFDEGYHSHEHYQFEKMESWIENADVMVFVGTSFAVTITDVALEYARNENIPVFNLNLNERLNSSSRLNVENLIGKSEQILPKLVEEVKKKLSKRLMQA